MLQIKHKKVSEKVDSADATLIQPSNWNDVHEITTGPKKIIGNFAATTGAAQEVSIGEKLELSDEGVLDAGPNVVTAQIDPITEIVDLIGPDTIAYPITNDQRKLKKWFTGGIAGKSVVLSGDSTTWLFQHVFGLSTDCIYRDGRRGRVQTKYPEFRDVTVYARGENGGTLVEFVNNSYTDNHRDDPSAAFYSSDTPGNLSDLIALHADLYVLCWGINDCRLTTSYTAAMLQADLTTAVNAIRTAVPKACIILRMPNAHAADDVGAYLAAGVTAQNMMTRYQTAYRALRGTWPDVLLWDSQAGLFPEIAPATAANCPLIADDSLHPSTSGLDQTLDAIFGLATPAVNNFSEDLAIESSKSNPFTYNTTDGLIRWNPDVDPSCLNGPDWYKVYAVGFSGDAARGSYLRLSFLDYSKSGSSAARNDAWENGRYYGGLAAGDVVSLENRAGQAYTFVVNAEPTTQQDTANLQYGPHPAGTWSATETEDGIAGHPVPADGLYFGYVYRHKYAHCEGMRKLQSLLADPTSYDVVAATVNPYAVKRRFYIVSTPALGAITVGTITSETGGDLSARTWSVDDTIFIPGISSGLKSGEYLSAIPMTLTDATFTPDPTYKRMAITGVTSGGALVDFSKYVIPQGYVLSAT